MRLNIYVKCLLLLIIGVVATPDAGAVFKERDFGRTIEVLCAELELKYKEQQETLFSVHGQPLQSLTVAGGNPFHFSSLEDPQGDYLGSTPCRGNVIFDEFIKTATRLYYNSLVIGTMGSGKSTLLKKRFLARAIRGDFVRTFDISGEFTLLTRTLGGKVLKLDGAQGILNPLEILRSGETEGVSYMRHISKVSTIYRFLVGHDVPSGELLDFEDLLRELYEEWGLSPREAGAASEIRVTGLPAERYPIFSDLLTYIDRKIETMKNANYEGMAETRISSLTTRSGRLLRRSSRTTGISSMAGRRSTTSRMSRSSPSICPLLRT